MRYGFRPSAATAAMAVVFSALAAWPAQAEVRRYALLVGANRGLAHEAPLRYAESDVDRVAETLAQIGGYASERIVRLTAPTAARARTALVDLNLAIWDAVRAGHEAVLFVYYSGHADGRSLHLGATELATEEWSKLVRLSPAKLKVLLLDACRSGALTRVKGGRQVAPFRIGLDDQLRNEGYAIITSSSAGEDAQESDALRSSIFTHHFLTALRGPADVNRDLQVTLGEAYAYAYEQALKTSLSTVVGSQHATFDYDLRGRADPILSDLRKTGEQGRLVLPSPGEYLILSADTGVLLFEASVKTPRTALLLPAARYALRMRTRSNVYEGEVALQAGVSVAVTEDNLRPVPLAQVVRKGENAATLALGPSVAGTMHGALASGFSPMTGAQVGWAFELPRITLMPRISWSIGRSLALKGDVRSHTISELTAELTALYVFDTARFSVAPLLSLGAGRLEQRLEKDSGCQVECSLSARPIAFITTVGAWSMTPLGRGFMLEGSLELANFYLRQQQDTRGTVLDAPRTGTLTWRAAVGLGYRY